MVIAFSMTSLAKFSLTHHVLDCSQGAVLRLCSLCACTADACIIKQRAADVSRRSTVADSTGDGRV